MSVLSVSTVFERNLIDRLPAILLMGGALNGFIVRIAEQWQLEAGPSILFGISPFELITIAVAATLYFESESQATQSRPAETGFGIAEGLFLASLLIPSSTMSWIATGAYALFHAMRTCSRTGSGERTAALLFVGLALCSIWSSVVMKWIAVSVTTWEAGLIWYILSFLRDDIHLSGNIIGIPDGHKIILLIACSTIYGLPKAILGLTAITLFLGPVNFRNLVRSALVVSVIYTIANLVRLSVMTWSDPAFRLAHGPIGANIFDAVISIMVILAAFTIARRPDNVS